MEGCNCMKVVDHCANMKSHVILNDGLCVLALFKTVHHAGLEILKKEKYAYAGGIQK